MELFGFRGFWQMASRHMKTAFFEMYRSLSKPAFVRAVQELVPDVRSEFSSRAAPASARKRSFPTARSSTTSASRPGRVPCTS